MMGSMRLPQSSTEKITAMARVYLAKEFGMRNGQRSVRGQLALLLGVFLMASLGLGTTAATKEEVIERMREDLKYLAGDECEGRGIYTKGIEKAATYIAEQFKKAGLKPGGKDMTYFQPFTVSAGQGKVEVAKLSLKGPQGQTIELGNNKEFVVLGTSGSGKITAPVVFVGYGISAPDLKYDDYKGLDVKDKIVVVLRKTPRYDSKDAPFGGAMKMNYAVLASKLARAEVNKAAAVILVNDAAETGDKLDTFSDMGKGFSTSSIPMLGLKRDVLDRMLVASGGQSLADIEKAIDRDLQPRSAELSGWKATVETKVTKKTVPVKNVIGVRPGHGPLAKEFIVIGAHYDHLGFGEPGTLAKKPEDQKKIHHGADDNGSGTTSVIELARRFGEQKKWEGRTLIFMTFSGEEKGLLGSRFYCNQQPLFALADTAAMVNLDMVGRMDNKKTGEKKLIVEGTGTAKGFDAMIEKHNKKFEFKLTKRPAGGPYSDHDPFYQKKIPIVFIWTDTHEDYHRPTDTWDKINYADMARIVDLAEEVITELATEKERPEYVAVAPPAPKPGPGKGPKLGFAPSYGTDVKGVLVGPVSENGPAAKAGIKMDDVITAINDQPVTNLQTYMAIMGGQKAGQPISVTVQRGKEKLTLKATPQ
jgi:hypothetical protein